MTNLEHLQNCSINELARVLYSFTLDNPAQYAFNARYCEQCPRVKTEDGSQVAYCALNGGCRYFGDEDVTGEDIIGLWLMKEHKLF